MRFWRRQYGLHFGLLTAALGLLWGLQAAVPSANAIPRAPAAAESTEETDEPQGAGTIVEPGTQQTEPSPYQVIIARNAFRLNPPPPPPPPPDPAAAPVIPSALKLTGLTTMKSGKRALFVLQEPGKQEVFSDLVREGDYATGITNLRVLQIDERANIVKVNFGGKEMAMNFEDNGIKAKPAATVTPGQPGQALAGKPGAPSQPGLAVAGGTGPSFPGGARPPFQAGAATFAADNASGLRSLPTRPIRGGMDGTSLNLAGAYTGPTTYPGGATYGGLPGGSSYNLMPNQAQLQQAQAQQAQLQQAQAVPAIPPEQAIMNMNLQQKHAEQQGYSLPPPLPLPGMENAQQQPGAGASGNFPPGFPGFPPVPGR